MTPDLESIFPYQISDQTAVAFSEFLHAMADQCDAQYAHRLRRYYAKQRVVYDLDHPWISPPSDNVR